MADMLFGVWDISDIIGGTAEDKNRFMVHSVDFYFLSAAVGYFLGGLY